MFYLVKKKKKTRFSVTSVMHFVFAVCLILKARCHSDQVVLRAERMSLMSRFVFIIYLSYLETITVFKQVTLFCCIYPPQLKSRFLRILSDIKPEGWGPQLEHNNVGYKSFRFKVKTALLFLQSDSTVLTFQNKTQQHSSLHYLNQPDLPRFQVTDFPSKDSTCRD